MGEREDIFHKYGRKLQVGCWRGCMLAIAAHLQRYVSLTDGSTGKRGKCADDGDSGG